MPFGSTVDGGSSQETDGSLHPFRGLRRGSWVVISGGYKSRAHIRGLITLLIADNYP